MCETGARHHKILSEEGKKIKNMCDVLDRIESKGKKEGKLEAKKEMVVSLHNQGVDISIIAKATGVAVEEIMKWLGLQPA